jgi:hypothetical protein
MARTSAPRSSRRRRPHRSEPPRRFRSRAKSRPRMGIRRAKSSRRRGGFLKIVSAALSMLAPAAGKAKSKPRGKKGALLAILGAGGGVAAATRRRRNHEPVEPPSPPAVEVPGADALPRADAPTGA